MEELRVRRILSPHIPVDVETKRAQWDATHLLVEWLRTHPGMWLIEYKDETRVENGLVAPFEYSSVYQITIQVQAVERHFVASPMATYHYFPTRALIPTATQELTQRAKRWLTRIFRRDHAR